VVNYTSETKMRPKEREEPMKKLLSVLAVGMLVGALSSWAQTTNVTAKVDVALKATLSTGAKVTEGSLEGTGDLSALQLQIINGSTTNEVNVLAKNIVVTGGSSNLTSATILLKELSGVDLGKGKFVDVFQSTGVDTNINGAVWFISGTSKTKKGVTTLSGKVEGVWKDTVSAFKGSIGAVKK
jgi:hypothetical protein